MNIRNRSGLRARLGLTGLERAVSLIAKVIAAAWGTRSHRKVVRARTRIPETADEKTIRHLATMQAGGISSEESDARYASGENPGGLHHKAQRPPPDSEIFEPEEPPERPDVQRHRGFPRTMASHRR